MKVDCILWEVVFTSMQGVHRWREEPLTRRDTDCHNKLENNGQWVEPALGQPGVNETQMSGCRDATIHPMSP
ncbi:hypothetical protein LSAT2_027284, partial [Lamellibrachia satsuma]